ncbi:hypothetical protein [Spirilliplanes yamanashiensis]|uniref:hypothetical protein n=1 Tax=Spirilliplanes yamanashiensis TaxID=42233 RepID=UPI0019506335|nr:hypothetical protein [Spirilliplanes yamanashiensis]MDP9816040.1 hypothetical protein [Spirilliplanes yamanashiensis]
MPSAAGPHRKCHALTAPAPAHLLDDSGQPQGLPPRIGGSEAVAVILVAAGVVVSVWTGAAPPGSPGGRGARCTRPPNPTPSPST